MKQVSITAAYAAFEEQMKRTVIYKAILIDSWM